VGSEFLRGAICDFAATTRVRAAVKTKATSRHARVAELVTLAEGLCAEAGLHIDDITQTVLGSPGVYDPQRDALSLAGALPGWDNPLVLTELRAAFGDSLMMENDVDAAALAEQAHGHGRDVASFAFVSIGTGIGMGLVLDGRLHRGAHGAAGEIGFLPLDNGENTDAKDARKRGSLEASASAAGVVYAARRAGLRAPLSARKVFDAAAEGDERAIRVVRDEALLIARAVCSVVAVADPHLVVLGGGIGQAAGLLEAVQRELARLAPVLPELRVSALGADSVVDGCLAAGIERAWQLVLGNVRASDAAGAQ
jgi:predicted NBD/HSP70 family sugar kinase